QAALEVRALDARVDGPHERRARGVQHRRVVADPEPHERRRFTAKMPRKQGYRARLVEAHGRSRRTLHGRSVARLSGIHTTNTVPCGWFASTCTVPSWPS